MDVQKYVKEYLRAHRGIRYSADELAMKINAYDRFDFPIMINPNEVLTAATELAKANDKVKHSVSLEARTVLIDGERRQLLMDSEYLRYDVVADLAPHREDEVEGMSAEEMISWIIEELADEIEEDLIEHKFEWQEPG